MVEGKKTAVILGASGLVGKELVNTLFYSNHYSKIYLLVRRPIQVPFEGCETRVIDFDKIEDYSELFAVNDVFCCLGTTIKKVKTQEAFRKVDYEYPLAAAKLAKEKGVDKFLIVTAMGANSKSPFFYNRVKGEIEDALRTLNLSSLHIFRPSLLLGKRDEFRLGEKLAEKASFLINTIMMGPLRPYRGIQVKKVAAAMAFIAQTKKSGINVYKSDEIDKMIAFAK